MNKILANTTIFLIKIYKYLFSPFLGNKCRFLPSCSDYFIESLIEHGFLKGFYYGIKRILRCHPIKLLGGGSGLDFVTKKGDNKNG